MSELNLESLRTHSESVGVNWDLVQAAGGNTSLKSETKIWIKGSGKRLRDSKSENIFVCLDVGRLSTSEIASIEDFSSYVVGNQSNGSGLSPSIETNFHILIRNPVITHLHSLGSLMIAVSNCASEIVQKIGSRFEIALVPYARPGMALAKLIQKDAKDTCTVYILRNHGVIFSSDSFESMNILIHDFESFAKEWILGMPQKDENPTWIEILAGGVLTPDEAVFLGPTPFLLSNEELESNITISELGKLNIPISFSDDKVQLANFYVRLAKAIHKRTNVEYLPSLEVQTLLNWDKEISRIRMAR